MSSGTTAEPIHPVAPVPGTLAALGTLGVGYVARPIGAGLFGHFGDRIGRKAMLIVTLVLMGVSTFLIGLLPTYAAIGIAAPTFLILVIDASKSLLAR